MHYENNQECPFGSGCTYAHGEEELQLTKLMDLQPERNPATVVPLVGVSVQTNLDAQPPPLASDDRTVTIEVGSGKGLFLCSAAAAHRASQRRGLQS